MIYGLYNFIRRNVPWVVVDAVMVVVSLALALSARALTTSFDVRLALPFGPVAIGVCYGINYLFRIYHRIWRYASAGEIVVIVAAVAISSAL